MSENWETGAIVQRRYEISEIEMGGMGIVYLCYDHLNKKPIAIKTFHDEYIQDRAAIERFKLEADTWISLEKHRNIVQAYWVKITNDRPYIYIELVRGKPEYGSTLKDWIQKRAMDIKTSLDFSIQFCLGMEYAGKRFEKMGKPFIHRDIKPENIMITSDRTVKITDFGMTKTFVGNTAAVQQPDISVNDRNRFDFMMLGSVCGTPPYMSPEQCRGEEELDIRSDIYSFGCVLYEMLTCRPPFLCDSNEMYLKKHMEEQPVNVKQMKPEVPGGVGDAVMKCLEKNQDRRYQSFTQLKEALLEEYHKYTGERLNPEGETEELTVGELIDTGASFRELERNEEALAYYERVLKLDPESMHALNNKGLALSALGRAQESIDCFDQLLQANPRNHIAWSNKGIVFIKLGQEAEALKCFDAAIELDSEYYYAWVSKGGVLNRIGRNEEAILCLDRAIQLNPDIYEVWDNKGLALSDLGRNQEALECFDIALELNPTSLDALNNKTNELLSLDRKAEAIECYEMALALRPESDELWVNKGSLLYDLGRMKESLECYDNAIRLNQHYYNAWNNKANTLAALGRNEEALECYRFAVSLEPGAFRAWFNMGNAYSELGRKEEAMKCYDHSIELNPGFYAPWNNRGLILLELGRVAEALESLERGESLKT